MNRVIGVIGYGNMGKAIAEQVKDDYQVYCFDRDAAKTTVVSSVTISPSLADLITKAGVIILAVKPQDFDSVLKEIQVSGHNLADKLFISIAAGITTAHIEKTLGVIRVIRVMPNMAIKVGQGISCLCKGSHASSEDFDFSDNLFSYMGQTLRVAEERMDAATAISGSGPGFYFDIVESNLAVYQDNPDKILKDFIISLMQAAEKTGFSHDEAVFLATGTGIASQGLIIKTKLSPAELKKQITSKGGTTEAGLEALHRTGSLIEAVEAAKKRAQELSKN